MGITDPMTAGRKLTYKKETVFSNISITKISSQKDTKLNEITLKSISKT